MGTEKGIFDHGMKGMLPAHPLSPATLKKKAQSGHSCCCLKTRPKRKKKKTRKTADSSSRRVWKEKEWGLSELGDTVEAAVWER